MSILWSGCEGLPRQVLDGLTCAVCRCVFSSGTMLLLHISQEHSPQATKVAGRFVIDHSDAIILIGSALKKVKKELFTMRGQRLRRQHRATLSSLIRSRWRPSTSGHPGLSCQCDGRSERGPCVGERGVLVLGE